MNSNQVWNRGLWHKTDSGILLLELLPRVNALFTQLDLPENIVKTNTQSNLGSRAYLRER